MRCQAVISEDGEWVTICNRPGTLRDTKDGQPSYVLCNGHRMIHDVGADLKCAYETT